MRLVSAHLCCQLELGPDGKCHDEKDLDMYEKMVSAFEEIECSGFQGKRKSRLLALVLRRCGEEALQQARIDSDAQLSDIGREEARFYSAASGTHFIPSEVSRMYKFGNETFTGIESIHIYVLVAKDILINVTPRLVNANVPFLLGLGVLIHFKALVNSKGDRISSHHGNCSISRTRKLGYLS